jgi:hypothetical protein
MDTRRVAAVMIGASLIAVWATASAGSRQGRVVTYRPVLSMAAAAPVAGHSTSSWLEAPGGWRQTREPVSLHRRNLFRERERVAAPTRTAARPGSPSIDVLALELVSPPPPSVTLLGIAEQLEDGHVVRTAVLREVEALWLVREGEPVGTRFRVTRIGAEDVGLTDTQSGAALTLRLR